MDLREYTNQDAVGLALLIRGGEVTAAEVQNAAHRAVEAVEPALSATVGDLVDPPLGADDEGPLAGVPTAMKEVAPHLAGQVSALGSRWALEGIMGVADTELGSRIRGAGLRVIARSRSPEFAFNVTTEPVAHGPTRNPWNLDYSVGGSSGGSAALVAARALPIAHGTDGGGSIRIPASLCGVVGLKPTRSRIPVGPGLWEALHGMSHDFVLCRTLRDAAAALDALNGPGPGDKYLIPPPERPYADELGREPRRTRIRWSTAAWSGEPVAPACSDAVVAAAVALEGLGHDVDSGSPSIEPDVLHRALVTTWAAGLAHRAAGIEPLLGEPPSPHTLEACTLAMIRRGAGLSAMDLLDGYGGCNTVGRAIGAFFETTDVLLLPTVARPPWRLGELDQNDESLDCDGWVRRLFSEYAPFTAMFNISGQPAVSLPLAWSSDGLPIGVQLVGRYGDEATLLGLASQLERSFPWAGAVPPHAAA